MGNILVSIHCATYNHEKYIADAIESFIMQKTDFKFEVLIHDDASTDKTVEIIREYERRYPNLIKPIYQTQNQKSMGNSISKINFARAKGKYIAICEGDDYWTDPYKLQKQADYMEKHPECSLCVHGAYIVNDVNKTLVSQIRPSKENKIFQVEDVIGGGGGLFATNSMFFPLKYAMARPKFVEIAPVGDYPQVINLALCGNVYYFGELMSVYRLGVPGSWTLRKFSTIEKKKKHFLELNQMLDELNHFTNYMYDNVITLTKKRNQFYLLIEQRQFKEAKSSQYKEIYRNLGFYKKGILWMDEYTPSLYKILLNLKRNLMKFKNSLKAKAKYRIFQN